MIQDIGTATTWEQFLRANLLKMKFIDQKYVDSEIS